MCLAVPGKIVERHEENGLAMGTVDFAGTTVSVCLAYVPEAEVGNYVIVHAGFALNVLDEEEAQKTLALFDEIDVLTRKERENQPR
jgi:hydrogenase expression/formation protein HypC